MRTISAPAGLSGAPLAELKQWLAITTDADDALLVDLLGAALALCERFTGVVPMKSEVRETVPASASPFTLAARPVYQFLGATAVGQGLDRRLLAESDIAFAREGSDGGTVTLAAALHEPQIELRYYAGLADEWATLEPGLRHGILRHAAHQYRERDSGPSETPPAAIAALWRPYRRMRL